MVLSWNSALSRHTAGPSATPYCFRLSSRRYGRIKRFSTNVTSITTELYHIKLNHPVNFHFSPRANCTDFIAKNEWPPNSIHLSIVCGMQCFRHFIIQSPGPSGTKSVLQQIWDDLPQTMINKAINDFPKRLNARASASGGHFEHTI